MVPQGSENTVLEIRNNYFFEKKNSKRHGNQEEIIIYELKKKCGINKEQGMVRERERERTC